MMEESAKILGGIKFSVWSPTEVRKFSVAEVTAPETYDEDGMPVQGGLMDNRLGTLEPGQKCATCGNTSAKCPGHFGHIELAEPVLHIAFVDDIHKLLLITVSTTPFSEGLTPTEVSLRYGPFTSNSLYSSMNLGGDVLPIKMSPPLTTASCMIAPSCSSRRYAFSPL